MDYNNLNDYEILSYVSENNDEANTIIFEKYKPLICDRASKLYTYCKNRGVEINDLIQEGMVGLNDAIIHFSETYDNCFYTYALKCINSRIISYIIKAGRFKNKILNESINFDYNSVDNNTFCNGLVDNSYNPEEILISEENENEILKIIENELSDAEKQAILLKINGFSYKEISGIIGKTVKNVDNTIQRAKNKIRERLNDKV